jgi:hypothetical protein
MSLLRVRDACATVALVVFVTRLQALLSALGWSILLSSPYLSACLLLLLLAVLLDANLSPHTTTRTHTPSDGVFILEVNLSCNLFNGAFDSASYYRLLWHYFDQIENISCAASVVTPSQAN